MMHDLGEPIAHGATATLYAYGMGAALKLYREGFPLEEAEREAAKARMAFAAGIRTPAVRAVVTVAGRPGVVFDRVNGPPLADVARTELIMRYATLPDDWPKSEIAWLTRERDALAEAYRNAYHAIRPFDRSEAAAWLPVVAAARRHDRIPESERALMQEIVAESKP